MFATLSSVDNAEDLFLEHLSRRSLDDIARHLALHPTNVHTVRSCKQPTVHFLLQSATLWHPTSASGTEQPAVNRVDGSTVDALELLVSFGADLAAVDGSSGNTVFHSAVSVGPSGEPIPDVAALLEWLLRHPRRPSIHTLNTMGLTAIEYAVRGGNALAVDTLLSLSLDKVTSRCELDAQLVGIPAGLAMGASDSRSDGKPPALRYRRLLSFAAQWAMPSIVRYLLNLQVTAATIHRICAFEARSCDTLVHDEGGSAGKPLSLSDRVRLFDTSPPAWDATPTTELWRREGTPFQLCCSHFSGGGGSGGLAAPGGCTPVLLPQQHQQQNPYFVTLRVLMAHAEQRHSTPEELDEEAARVAQRYHGHIPRKLPDAVLQLLRETDNTGRCSLHFAADGRKDGTGELIEFLLQLDNSLLQRRDAGGRTALDLALKSKRSENASFLLERYGDKGLGKNANVSGLLQRH